jgi:hypothetical protein
MLLHLLRPVELLLAKAEVPGLVTGLQILRRCGLKGLLLPADHASSLSFEQVSMRIGVLVVLPHPCPSLGLVEGKDN